MLWEGGTAEHWAAEWQVPRVVLFNSTTSTNDRARELAEQGTPHLTIVLADQQSAGRGQHGRVWLTGAGSSILLSIVLRTDGLLAPQLLPLRIGLAVARAIEARAGIAVQLKWPNDVLINGRKTGGILCEGSSSRSGNVVIAGIGLNVFQQDSEWPGELRASATSIAQQVHASRSRIAHPGVSGTVYFDDCSITREKLIGAIIDEARIAPFNRGVLAPEELEAWAQRDFLSGKRVRVDGSLPGIVLGIARDGALRFQTESGIELVRNGSVRVDDGIS